MAGDSFRKIQKVMRTFLVVTGRNCKPPREARLTDIATMLLYSNSSPGRRWTGLAAHGTQNPDEGTTVQELCLEAKVQSQT